jgi:hypothetical protein
MVPRPPLALLALLPVLAPSAAGAYTERLEVGGGTITVAVGPEEPSVPRPALRRWVERCAKTVSSYLGRFPVERYELDLVTGAGGDIHSGTTWGGRSPRTRLTVGRATTEADFETDWLLTHEMTHLAFPDMDLVHHWIEEGLATYAESIARARVGWLGQEEMWRGLANGMPQGLARRGDGPLDGTRAWGRTYWGGAIFWLLADVQIHEQTKDRRGIADALHGIAEAGGSIEVHWPIARALAAGDRATGTTVLSDLYSRLGRAAGDVTDDTLDALWKRLGVVREGRRVRLDDRAPLASVRRAISSPRS